MRTLCHVATSAVAALAAAASAGGAPAFYPLSDLADGSAWSEARAVSGDGSTVVGYSGPSPISGFRWTPAGGMVSVPGLQQAWAVSHDGTAIAGEGGLGDTLTRWSIATGTMTIPKLAEGNGYAFLRGMSGDGNVVTGGSSSANSIGSFGTATEAFHWTPGGGTVGLGDLGGGEFHSFGHGVSADGLTIVGGGSSVLGVEPVRWTQATGLVSLGAIPGGTPLGRANAVNADGSVVVGIGRGAGGEEAFRWTSAGGMVGLGSVVPDGISEARAVSADGSVVVGVGSMFNQGYGSGPFLWDQQHGMRELTTVLTTDYGLNLNGWLLLDAFGISADGRTIVGSAYNPIGQLHGYVAVVPEPDGTALLVATAAALLSRHRRRRPADC